MGVALEGVVSTVGGIPTDMASVARPLVGVSFATISVGVVSFAMIWVGVVSVAMTSVGVVSVTMTSVGVVSWNMPGKMVCRRVCSVVSSSCSSLSKPAEPGRRLAEDLHWKKGRREEREGRSEGGKDKKWVHEKEGRTERGERGRERNIK